MKPIYLDNNATTPLDGLVLDEMMPYLRGEFGNPSSGSHAYGWTAEAAVEIAREKVAAAMNASPEEVVFTSGATESDNLALRGAVCTGEHLIVSATEHEAVLETAKSLSRYGIEVTELPVDEYGRVDTDLLRESIRPNTALVSVILASNETGTLNRISELAEVAYESGIPLHTDAAQALGKVPLNVEELGADMMSLSAHKVYGPKGVGALYVKRREVRLAPQSTGGGQERGIRSGTLNVPGIVGFGKAVEIANVSLGEESRRIRGLRNLLRERLTNALGECGISVRENGHPEERLPGTLNVTLGGVDAGELLAQTPGVAASTGSACASRSTEPSHVLTATGLGESEARSTLRFGVGRFTTCEEIEEAARLIAGSAARLIEVRAGSQNDVRKA